MAPQPLYFIRPQVLDRLRNGQFVARRQQKKEYALTDRRQMLSPLNVTRRAIAYEPLVFGNRVDTIIQCAEALNAPRTKLVLISGPAGRGKTALMRAVTEMMGGDNADGTPGAQLLWYDVSRHTDYDEIIRFLVEYLTYLCQSAEATLAASSGLDPVAALELLLRQVAHFPILLVLDNVEFLVTPDQTVRSRELKEAFNFLLTFPNVKLMLAGRQLPLSDMNPATGAVAHVPLAPLSLDDSIAMIAAHAEQPEAALHAHEAGIARLGGEPGLLELASVLSTLNLPSYGWDAIPETGVVQWLMSQLPLSAAQNRALQMMSLIRHGATLPCLDVMLQCCDSQTTTAVLKALPPRLFRVLLRKVYPPQLVLGKLRHRVSENDRANGIDPFYQLPDPLHTVLAEQVSDADRVAWHDALQRFYTVEKNKHILERFYQSRTQHLTGEAQYHANRAKRAKNPITADARPSAPTESMIKPLVVPERQDASSRHERKPGSQTAPIPPWAGYARDEDTEMPSTDSGIARSAAGAMAFTPYPVASLQLTESDLDRLADLITARVWNVRHEAAATETDRTALAGIHSSEEAPPETPSGWGMLPLTFSPEEAALAESLRHALAMQDRMAVISLLRTLGYQRFEQGHAALGKTCYLHALQLVDDTVDSILVAQLHADLSRFCRQHYEHNQALRHAHQARLLLETSPATGRAEAVTMLSQVLTDIGMIALYRDAFEEAATLLRQAVDGPWDDARAHAEAVFQLGLAYDGSGRLEDAAKCYRQSFRLAESAADAAGCAASLYNLASLYLEADALAQARQTLTHCLRYDEQAGSEAERIRTLMVLSVTCARMNASEEAVHHAREAARISRAAGLPTEWAEACMHLGQLYETLASWTEAQAAYREAQQAAGQAQLSAESDSRLRHKLQSVAEHLAHDPLQHRSA